jgi:phosphatidylglycerophosphatase A
MSPINRILRFFASGFYSGLLPGMPGTYASLVACGLLYGLCIALPVISTMVGGILIAAVVTIVAIPVSNAALDGRLFGEGKDPGAIVIDEFAGCAAAVAGLECSPALYFAAFFLFRIFDILKPPPVRTLEGLPRGWGVVLDDVAAGVLANVVIQIALLFVS